jgi:cellulose synthase/poly-beta-1,6-N-acetylglucosamine synthase-like glycosyltransferase
LITCAGILPRNVKSFSQAQPLFFSSEIGYREQARLFLPQGSSGWLVEKMKVSIVIPCYNEKDTIERIVEAVRSAAIESKEIIVVDDCSLDGTPAVLEDKVSRMVDRIIYHPVNRGKGAALRSGVIIE